MPNSHGICQPCADRLIEDAKELKESKGKKEENDGRTADDQERRGF